MKVFKIMLFISIFFLICGCTDSESSHISKVKIKLKEPSPNHIFIIEVNAVDQPQYLDYTAMENANLFHTNKHQEATITFERNLKYNIKIYSTSSNNSADIKKGNYKSYMNNLIYENEQSFKNKEDILAIKEKQYNNY